QSTHLRLRFLRSARRCSAMALARSLAFLPSSVSLIRVPLERFDQESNALPTPDAGGADAVARPPALQLVQQVHGDAGPGCAQRVPHRDGATVHVGAVAR